MSKKSKTLLTWLTVLAMMVSMLHVGTGSGAVHAAEGDPGGQAQGGAKTVTGSAIGYELELGKTYDGTVTLKGNGKGGYESYFHVAVADIAVDDVFDVSVTMGDGSQDMRQIAIQSDCDGWDWGDKYVHTKWVGDGLAAGTQASVSLRVTEELSGGFQLKIYMDNPKADAQPGENLDISLSSLKIMRQEKPEPIGSDLLPGTFYAGDVTLNKSENAYEAYFNVTDPQIAVGDVYDVSLTIGDNAGIFQQVAIQSDCDGWAWDGHATWVSSALPGTKVATTLEVTKEMPGAFQIKIYMDNAKEAAGDSVLVGISGLKVTKQGEELPTPTPDPTSTPTPTPDPDVPSDELADNMELTLGQSYSGKKTMQNTGEESPSYSSYFVVKDAALRVGDIYVIEFTLSGADGVKQVAVQGTHNKYEWGSGIENAKDDFKFWAGEGIADGTKVTLRVGVTDETLSGSFQFKMVFDNVVGTKAPEALNLTIKNLKVTKEVQITDADRVDYVEGSKLALEKAYKGTITLTKNDYDIYTYTFHVSDPAMKVGDTYKIKMVIGSGAASFKQVAVQSECSDDFKFLGKWLNDGYADGSNFTMEMPVTAVKTAGGFALQFCVGNRMDDVADPGAAISLQFKDLYIAAERKSDGGSTGGGSTGGGSTGGGSTGGGSTGGGSTGGGSTPEPTPVPTQAPTPTPELTPKPTPTAVPTPTAAPVKPGEEGKNKVTITRKIPGGTKEVVKKVESNKTLDSSSEDTKMYQIPMQEFDGSGKMKKILVTITFDQSTPQGWTDGEGAIGYSTDGEWQQVSFPAGFVDGQKNTQTIEVVIPDGVNPTFDEESIVQVGWWWGSTPSITVDKVEFVFEQPGQKEISITVNEDAPMVATKPGESVVSLTELAAQIAKVDKIELHMAATGKFKANVYALLADEGEIPLMAENKVKLGEIMMDNAEGGYQTFVFDGLAGSLAGDIIIEVKEMEEGASVVLDAVSLFGADDEELTSPVPDTDDGEDTGEKDKEDGAETGNEDREDVEDAGDEDGEEEGETGNEKEDDGEDAGNEDHGDNADGADASEEALPKTGLLDSKYFYLLGLAIMMAGALLAMKKRRGIRA
ncbi:MAG: LPXTG cell wall anchor domain-containing protein [Lachnospiraceae bacterium]|nr:LPXTG cell wall anchor domain-containing protein [Lachnospiraceae bacterium]